MTKHSINSVAVFNDPKRAAMFRQVSLDAPSKAGLFKRVYAGTASPRMAIKAKCLECCWHCESAISGCTASECPLWNLRPFQAGGRNE